MSEKEIEAGSPLRVGQVDRPRRRTLEAIDPDRQVDEDLRARVSAVTRSRPSPGGRHVRWVRPSDLASDAGAKLAGHGITLSRRIHRAPRDLMRATKTGNEASKRIDRLAPADAFGIHKDGRPDSGLRR
jgi:hypothetical protein